MLTNTNTNTNSGDCAICWHFDCTIWRCRLPLSCQWHWSGSQTDGDDDGEDDDEDNAMDNVMMMMWIKLEISISLAVRFSCSWSQSPLLRRHGATLESWREGIDMREGRLHNTHPPPSLDIFEASLQLRDISSSSLAAVSHPLLLLLGCSLAAGVHSPLRPGGGFSRLQLSCTLHQQHQLLSCWAAARDRQGGPLTPAASLPLYICLHTSHLLLLPKAQPEEWASRIQPMRCL